MMSVLYKPEALLKFRNGGKIDSVPCVIMFFLSVAS